MDYEWRIWAIIYKQYKWILRKGIKDKSILLGSRNGIKLKDKSIIEMKSQNVNIELLNMIGDVKNKGDMRVDRIWKWKYK